MQSFEHYILTVFNVDRGFDKTNQRNNPEYLEKRFELFELVTVPSITSQTNQNFTWCVFFDKNTPENFKQRAKEILKLTNCLPVYVDGEKQILTFLKERLLSKTQCLVTTNLDNDDALHKNFVKIIHSNFRDEQIYLLNFPLGYMLRKDSLLMREYFSSPFHTIIEPVSEQLITCLSVPHNQLYSLSLKGVPVYQLSSEPAWLQLVHDTNVSNCLDVNAVLVFDINKINNFGINALPSQFTKLYNAEFRRLNFCIRLISDKKKTYKHRAKLLAYTLLPFIAPLRIKLKFLFQPLRKQLNQGSLSEIRRLLSDID
ncbi:MAG TPA: glycosyltransferase [Candidatus Obscuribacterales bacterium]